MTTDEAGRLQAEWKTKHGDKLCHHSRVIDTLTAPDKEVTGKVVCQECGAIVPDPRQSSP
jgi:hypothetical protein